MELETTGNPYALINASNEVVDVVMPTTANTNKDIEDIV